MLHRLLDYEALAPKIPTICGAAAGGVASGLAMVGELAVQLLGVGLPVVMGAASGACVARSLSEPVGFARAFVATAGWTVFGCTCAPMLQWVAQTVLGYLGAPVVLPTGVLAGFGAILSAAPLWVPKIWPTVQAWLNRKSGGGNAGA